MKIAFILMLARTVTQHNAAFLNHNVRADFILLGKIALVSAPPMLIVLLQNDLGTTLVFIAIVIGLVLMSGITWKY